MFTAVLFTIAKVWKQTECRSVGEWINKDWYIYTMEYYMAIKKEGTFTCCDSMDRPGHYYAK